MNDTNDTENTPLPDDPWQGQGGRYVIDPTTGRRTLLARTDAPVTPAAPAASAPTPPAPTTKKKER